MSLLANILKDHVGHRIEIAEYGNGVNYLLKDMDTYEVVLNSEDYELIGKIGYKIGDIVTIITRCPDGVIGEDVLGKTGIVTEVVEMSDCTNYHVRYNLFDRYGFVFAENQIRYATPKEIKDAYKNLMR